jgi:hypothetical protein
MQLFLRLCILLLTIVGLFCFFFTVQSFAHALFAKNHSSPSPERISMMKDVGEAYMDHFGLTATDFQTLKQAHITHIEGNFDICASDSDVQYFLDQSYRYGLKVILPAGAGEAEWGYTCDQNIYPRDQKPVWQSQKVVHWVNKWKHHPAVYAWDTSNEAGSVMPNASWRNEAHQTIPDAFYLNAQQLQVAYKDVKKADPTHPVMIRMNGWFFYDFDDNFFRPGNPFASRVADIVMINAYSNVSDYYDDFVTTVATRAQDSIKDIDPKVKLIISLGVWEEKPLWYLPTPEQLKHDIAAVHSLNNIAGLAYFKYGAKGSEWYLPEKTHGAPQLFEILSKTN